MKVHFFGTLEGNKQDFQRITDLIREFGYQLVTDHYVKKEYESVKRETSEETQLYVKKMHRWIRQADIIVTETTCLGLGVGFETAVALQTGKPVIVLYKPTGDNTPFVLRGSEIERLQLLEYNDDTLRETLKVALELASEQVETRFTMILPADINSYLNEVADNRSGYIRRLIRRDMRERQGKK